jgi:hypothetical protein
MNEDETGANRARQKTLMRILRGLTGRMLSCGCVIGAYETYQGTVVWILDERDPTCANPTHESGQSLADVPES